MENENSIRKTARKAVEYWAEQIDFEKIKNNELLDEKIKLAEEYFKRTSPVVLMAIKSKGLSFKEHFFKELRRHSPTEAQLEVFKQNLYNLIVKDVSEQKCCYLFTDEEGARLKLAIIAEQCGIEYDEKSWFKKNVEMFVTEKKVELRYDKNQIGLTTFYDEDQIVVGKNGK